MKKIAAIATLALAAVSASAFEVGARGTFNSDNQPNTVGVTVGQKFGLLGVEGSFDRSTRGDYIVNKYGVLGSYDVATFNQVTIAPKAGVTYITSNIGNGYALVAGIGASYPLSNNVNLVADYSYVYARDRINTFGGNQISTGIKVSF